MGYLGGLSVIPGVLEIGREFGRGPGGRRPPPAAAAVRMEEPRSEVCRRLRDPPPLKPLGRADPAAHTGLSAEGDPFLPPDCWHRERTNVCCFKARRLRSLVTATVGNSYTWHLGHFLASSSSDFCQQPCEQQRVSVLGLQMTQRRLRRGPDTVEAGSEPRTVCLWVGSAALPPEEEQSRSGLEAWGQALFGRAMALPLDFSGAGSLQPSDTAEGLLPGAPGVPAGCLEGGFSCCTRLWAAPRTSGRVCLCGSTGGQLFCPCRMPGFGGGRILRKKKGTCLV